MYFVSRKNIKLHNQKKKRIYIYTQGTQREMFSVLKFNVSRRASIFTQTREEKKSFYFSRSLFIWIYNISTWKNCHLSISIKSLHPFRALPPHHMPDGLILTKVFPILLCLVYNWQYFCKFLIFIKILFLFILFLSFFFRKDFSLRKRK